MGISEQSTLLCEQKNNQSSDFPVRRTGSYRHKKALTRGIKKFVDRHSSYEIWTSYFVTFRHILLQLKCAWSSISPKLWFHCRRIVILGLPASHLPCNTNTNGEYGGWQSSSKPAFWLAASAWADVWSGALSWLQVTSVFSWTERIHERTHSFWRWERYLHGKWLAGRPRTILIQHNDNFGETLD